LHGDGAHIDGISDQPTKDVTVVIRDGRITSVQTLVQVSAKLPTLELGDYRGAKARQEAARKRGALYGIGRAMAIEIAGGPVGTPGNAFCRCWLSGFMSALHKVAAPASWPSTESQGGSTLLARLRAPRR